MGENGPSQLQYCINQICFFEARELLANGNRLPTTDYRLRRHLRVGQLRRNALLEASSPLYRLAKDTCALFYVRQTDGETSVAHTLSM